MPFINDPQGREEVEKVSRRLKLPVWKSFCKGNFRKWWNEWWDKIDTFAEEIEAIEIKTGTGLEGGGNLTKNRTLNLKKATKTELGGIIVGDNLTVDSNGVLNGNPAVDISRKLDKGKYLGDAGTLDEKIDTVSKSKLNNTGDNMIGFLNLITTKDTTSNPGTIILKNDLSEGNNGGIELDGYYKDPAIKISNFKGNNYLKLNPDGNTVLTGNNLETVNKEIFNGVNEVYKKTIGNSGLKFDESTIYIQTPGNKYVDTYYLDQNNKKMYRCIESTATTINSADYFAEETNNILAKIEKWTTGGAGWGAIAIRNYNTVTINIDISSVSFQSVLNAITIPERFRPVSVNKCTFPLTAWLGNNAYGTISINKNGTITTSRTDVQDTTFNITMTYLI